MQNTRKYHSMLNGNLRDLDTFSKHKKNNVLKSLIALSKYLGVYEQFKSRVKSYGITFYRQDSFESFLRIMNARSDVIEWVKSCMAVLNQNQQTFLKFVVLSGLRKGEAIESFNLLSRLCTEGKISQYYNVDQQSLEHFRFPTTFIRGSKNVFFTFIPQWLIQEISTCKPLSYLSLKKRLKKHSLKVRLNECRDHFGTYMVYHGLIQTEVDLLQGRIGKGLFMRHYFSPMIENLRDRTLNAVNEMTKSL